MLLSLWKARKARPNFNEQYNGTHCLNAAYFGVLIVEFKERGGDNGRTARSPVVSNLKVEFNYSIID